MQRVLFRCFVAASFAWPTLSRVSFAETTSRPNAFVPDTNRVKEIASLLSAQPVGVGRPISDRRAWQAVAKAPGFERVVSDAEKLLKQPVPKLTDDLYLDFSRTGNRTRCQRVLSLRQARVATLTLAECLENRGQFLTGIEEALRAICAEKTWVYPAHDRSLHNFHGDVTEIDLRVAGLSWVLATADYWLGDRLSPEMRQLLRNELERRTFQPFETMVNTGKPRLWWLSSTNNWNAVCLAGVTGSALAMIDSPSRRAFFIAAAEKGIRNFLAGFTPDGYCSEGIGYWNYGFGHPVPRVAGQLQRSGRSAAAKVLQTDFRESQDTIVFDLSSAYRVKELQELRRTFVFSREGNGSLTIIDEVTFASPKSFGVALITFSPWRQLSPQRLSVGNRTDSVRVDIAADGIVFQVAAEQIQEDLPGRHRPTRIGIDLTEPVTAARITIKITPATSKKPGHSGESSARRKGD